jgi:cytochrome c biogenesis protein CcdA/thiol-disulfide isomerase/thioredoxin
LLLVLIAYLGGALTILSPCILPILPFTFARADQPFRKTGLPLLGGMAITFALLASGAAVGGSWLVRTNQFGRVAALVAFAILGLSLLIPKVAALISQPFVRLGNALTISASGRSGTASSLLLGVATGLLWAPCAGPILGLILTSAAVQGVTLRTFFLLLSYALGAASSLAVAILAGGGIFRTLKRFLGAERWLRPALGAGILVAVTAVAFGFDRGILTRLSAGRVSSLEQGLLSALHPTSIPTPSKGDNQDEEDVPSFEGATAWLNSRPLDLGQLHGKVVLVDFWTYSCINCIRNLPYVEAWAKKYGPSGLVVVGVHTPEFAFEKDVDNVKKAIHDLGVTYPVALDNDYDIWSSFDNNYWPAHYLFDASGKLRYKHFGEGKTAESERWIQQLLTEQHTPATVPAGTVAVHPNGAQAAADGPDVRSPETYIGYERTKNFASPGGVARDRVEAYVAPVALSLNNWALSGRWIVHNEDAVSTAPGGVIRFKFHARDLHLVLGAASRNGIRYRVTIDGHALGSDHGVDTNANGDGIITDKRLYQLVRQTGSITDHDFEIQFFDSGVEAFAFTFG